MNLKDCTVADLRRMAADLGVANRSKLKKAELIAAILDAQAPTPLPMAQELASSSTVSSTNAPTAPAPVFGPNGDPGLPIPEKYESDRLVLMVQDPHHIFAYWELSSGTLDRVRTENGKISATLLLVYVGESSEMRVVDLASGNYYLSVPPGSACRVELAIRDANGMIHVLLRSNQVRTPADSISRRVDASWMDVSESFNSLLEMAQLPSGLSSAELTRRLEVHSWSVPDIPSSDTLAGFQETGEHLSSHVLSSSALSSSQLSSTAWQPAQR